MSLFPTKWIKAEPCSESDPVTMKSAAANVSPRSHASSNDVPTSPSPWLDPQASEYAGSTAMFKSAHSKDMYGNFTYIYIYTMILYYVYTQLHTALYNIMVTVYLRFESFLRSRPSLEKPLRPRPLGGPPARDEGKEDLPTVRELAVEDVRPEKKRGKWRKCGTFSSISQPQNMPFLVERRKMWFFLFGVRFVSKDRHVWVLGPKGRFRSNPSVGFCSDENTMKNNCCPMIDAACWTWRNGSLLLLWLIYELGQHQHNYAKSRQILERNGPVCLTSHLIPLNPV